MVPGSESHGKQFHLHFGVTLPALFVSDIWKLSFDYVATEFSILLLLCNGFWFLIVCLCVSESGGGTFCAVAALHLMDFVQVDLASNLRDSASIDTRMLLEWCLQVEPVLNQLSAIICQNCLLC